MNKKYELTNETKEFLDNSGNIVVRCKYFCGTLDEFAKKVGAEYRAAIELARVRFAKEEETK